MNKYQIAMLKNVSIKLFNAYNNMEETVKFNNDIITIYQNQNYTINNYILVFESNVISKVITVESLITEHLSNGNKVSIPISLNKPITNLKLYFYNDIIDPIELKIEYMLADKKSYDKLKEDELKIQASKKAGVRVTTGQALINVLFQPIDESYSYAKIELYSYMDEFPQLMARYKITDDLFFCAINNLAYGTYTVRVIEYNNDNEVIFSSEHYQVTLQRPRSTTNNTI